MSNFPEALARVLWYIVQEERAYNGKRRPGPAVQGLKQLAQDTNNNNTLAAFQEHLGRIVEHTKGVGSGKDGDKNFLNTMKLIHQTRLASSTPNDSSGGSLNSATTTALLMGFCDGLGRLPPSTQAALLQVASQVTLMNEANRVTEEVALAAVYLSKEALQSIDAWWRGEMGGGGGGGSGRHCAEAIVGSAYAIIAGLAVGVGGAALGALLQLGPEAAAAAAVGGHGLVIADSSQWTVAALVDRFTTQLFDLPREAAVERAYFYFGVTDRASTAEVNDSYRRLMLLLPHRDTNARVGLFAEVQAHLVVIKKARGVQL